MQRLGFTKQEFVALMGSHTIGFANTEATGPQNRWTMNPHVFDNSYFKEVLLGDKSKYYKSRGEVLLATDAGFPRVVLGHEARADVDVGITFDEGRVRRDAVAAHGNEAHRLGAAREDRLGSEGIPTTQEFRPHESVRLPIIQAAAAVGQSFGQVRSITPAGPSHVRIVGVADLLFHRWNCEAVEAKGKAAKGSKAKKMVHNLKVVISYSSKVKKMICHLKVMRINSKAHHSKMISKSKKKNSFHSWSVQ